MPNKSSLLNQNSYSNGELEKALLNAAEVGNTNEVMRLCEQGANIDAVNNEGGTTLHRAVFWNTEIVRILCEQGANINAVNKAGETALHLSARNGQDNSVRFLCELGANKEAKDNEGNTALHLAERGAHSETVRVLCEQGANIDAANNEGETALLLAARDVDTQVYLDAYKGLGNIVRYLCEIGANKEAKDNKGNTALHWVAFHGRIEFVRYLFEQGANIDAANNEGETALHLAARDVDIHIEGACYIYQSLEKIVRCLCELGANKEAKDSKGNTALHLAALRGRDGVVRGLLEAGADYRIKNNEGKTPFDIATDKYIRKLFSHRMIRDHKKTALEVAFSAYCNFEQPSELLPYPKGKEYTFDGTRYAMGIIAQLKNTHDTPNPIMHHILSYLPSMTGNKPAECMEIVANRKMPTQKIPVNGQSNDKKRNWQDKASKSKRQRISVREIKGLEINEFANVAPGRRQLRGQTPQKFS